MRQSIGAIALVVPSYEKALAFYVGVLGFRLVEDTPLSDGKRWVLVTPRSSEGTCILLARAATEEQRQVIGRQAGGRVFLFLHTDDFWRDYRSYQKAGVEFLEAPRLENYGVVAVFRDPFGNRWDLLQPADAALKA